MTKLSLKQLLSLVSLFFVSFAALAAPEPSTSVDNSIDKIAVNSNIEQGNNRSNATRSKEEISIVFVKKKGSTYRIYNRELRKDPTLAGKIVFELVISPAGLVTSVKILSSTVNSPDFEGKIAERMKLFEFESNNVDEMIIKYPMEFIPM